MPPACWHEVQHSQASSASTPPPCLPQRFQHTSTASSRVLRHSSGPRGLPREGRRRGTAQRGAGGLAGGGSCVAGGVACVAGCGGRRAARGRCSGSRGHLQLCIARLGAATHGACGTTAGQGGMVARAVAAGCSRLERTRLVGGASACWTPCVKVPLEHATTACMPASLLRTLRATCRRSSPCRYTGVLQ